MKNDRQTAVLQIIEETAVETQEQLMQLLAERGFACTQATVSRDIKQLHLIKAPDGKGGYRYAVSARMPKLNFEEKLQTIFRECVLSAENAQNLAVIKTMNGMANAAAFALDSMEDTDIVGTRAGVGSALGEAVARALAGDAGEVVRLMRDGGGKRYAGAAAY